MDREAFSCLRVRGYMATRTAMVKAMMLSPKLLARTPYRKISAFSMGWSKSASQISIIMPMLAL